MLKLLLFIFATPFIAQAERPEPPQSSFYRLGADASYFTTTANYESGGSSQTLPMNGSYTLTTGSLTGYYDWTNTVRTSAEVSFVQAHRTSDFYGSGSATGLNEIIVASQAWFPVRNFSLVPELAVHYPLWRTDLSSDQPLLGEGASQLRGGGWVMLRAKPIQPFAYAAYVYRDSGRSSLLSYALGAHYQHKLFWAEASWHGFSSMTDDVDQPLGVDRTNRENFLRQVNGGSFKNYSINPGLGAVKMEAGTQFGLWGFWGSVEFTTNGNDAADGWTARAGFNFSSEPTRIMNSPARQDKPFEVQDDKYDEALFQEKPVESKSKKIRRKVRKKQSIEKLLHETEQELTNEQEQH